MGEITLASVLAQTEHLSPQDRLRLVERLAASLHTAVVQTPTDWHQAVRNTYGILKDDPIERLPQLPLEEREFLLNTEDSYGHD